jgi:hypothetical protein
MLGYQWGTRLRQMLAAGRVFSFPAPAARFQAIGRSSRGENCDKTKQSQSELSTSTLTDNVCSDGNNAPALRATLPTKVRPGSEISLLGRNIDLPTVMVLSNIEALLHQSQKQSRPSAVADERLVAIRFCGGIRPEAEPSVHA